MAKWNVSARTIPLQLRWRPSSSGLSLPEALGGGKYPGWDKPAGRKVDAAALANRRRNNVSLDLP
jgi:hypothetical protein